MRYDLNLLRTFVALVEERSVTQAAERLGVTQPALSNTLTRLRGLFRDPLFVRARYGIQPTQKAVALAPAIAAALAELDRIVLGQQAFDPSVARDHLTIAANGYAEYVLLPHLVAELGQRAPGVRLRIIPYGTDLAETGVVSGTTALALGRITDPPDTLVVQSLMTDGLACIVRTHHPRVGDHLSREDYESLKHVNLLPPGRLRAGLFQALERAGLNREVVVSVTHFLAIPDLIAVTDYCSTLPQQICRRLADDKRLKILPSPVDLGRFPVQMAWHTRYRQDPVHRWLRELLADIANRVSSAQGSAADSAAAIP